MNETDVRASSTFLKAGAASLAVIVLMFLAELIVVVVWGLPPVFGTAQAWLEVLHRNRFLGIVQTFGLDIVAVAFHAPLYVAFYFLLRSSPKGTGTLLLALVFSFVGIAVYFATNPTFSMLYLSDKLYAADEAARARVLASAETLVAAWNGTGPIVATNLYGIAGILISVVMLQSRKFRIVMPILGIVGNALQLGPPVSLLPPLYLSIDPILVGAGGFLLIVWYVALAIRFWKEANGLGESRASIRRS
jgi:hypothetical protein